MVCSSSVGWGSGLWGQKCGENSLRLLNSTVACSGSEGSGNVRNICFFYFSSRESWLGHLVWFLYFSFSRKFHIHSLTVCTNFHSHQWGVKVPFLHPHLHLSSDPSNIHSHGNYMGRRRSLSVRFLVSKQAEGCFQYLFSFVCLVLVTAEFLSPFLNQILLFRVFCLCVLLA